MTTAQIVAVGDKNTAAGFNAVVADLVTLGDWQSGTVSVTITSGTSVGSATVTFPSAFTSSPFISVTLVTSVIGSGFRTDLVVTALSATSFTVRLGLSANVGSTINPSVHWQARAV
jgi:hypothetical protein